MISGPQGWLNAEPVWLDVLAGYRMVGGWERVQNSVWIQLDGEVFVFQLGNTARRDGPLCVSRVTDNVSQQLEYHQHWLMFRPKPRLMILRLHGLLIYGTDEETNTDLFEVGVIMVPHVRGQYEPADTPTAYPKFVWNADLAGIKLQRDKELIK